MEPPRGSLRVTVQGADPDLVQKILVRLEPMREGGTPYEVELDRLAERGAWETLISDVLVDAYVVSAMAYDTLNADPEETEPVLFSHPVQVIIPVDDVANVFLVMSDDYYGEKPPELPYFVAVVLSRDRIEQWETVDIRVYGGGGEPPLVLSGRSPLDEFNANHGTFSEPQELAYDLGEPVGSAQLTWTPPRNEGLRTLVLRLNDQKNNAVEMTVKVLVGKNIGSVDFGVRFHLAPGLSLLSKTSNVDEGVRFEGWVTVLDDVTREKPAQRTYEWTHADCGGSFESGGGPADGSFMPNDVSKPGTMFFSYFVADEDRPEEGACELSFVLTEWNQVDGNMEAGVSSELHFELVTEQLQPSTP